MSANEDGPLHKIPDGVTLNDLYDYLTHREIPGGTRIRFIPDEWGDGHAELQACRKADGVLYLSIANTGEE